MNEYRETLIQLLRYYVSTIPAHHRRVHRSTLSKVASGIRSNIRICSIIIRTNARTSIVNGWVFGIWEIECTRRIVGNTGSQSERNGRKIWLVCGELRVLRLSSVELQIAKRNWCAIILLYSRQYSSKIYVHTYVCISIQFYEIIFRIKITLTKYRINYFINIVGFIKKDRSVNYFCYLLLI